MVRVSRIITLIVFLLYLLIPSKIYGMLGYEENSWGWIVSLSLIVFVIFLLVLLIVYCFFYSQQKSKYLKLFSLKQIWNSSEMQDARRKSAKVVTNEIVLNEDKYKEEIENARKIIDFFNYMGLQVSYGLIDFPTIYNTFGDIIIDYWQTKNYRLLFYLDLEKFYSSNIYYKHGFEYLAESCLQFESSGLQREKIPFPFFKFGMNEYEEIYYDQKSRLLNRYFVVFLILSGISLVLFVISYFFYYGYI